MSFKYKTGQLIISRKSIVLVMSHRHELLKFIINENELDLPSLGNLK
jgi:hypothetical protein